MKALIYFITSTLILIQWTQPVPAPLDELKINIRIDDGPDQSAPQRHPPPGQLQPPSRQPLPASDYGGYKKDGGNKKYRFNKYRRNKYSRKELNHPGGGGLRPPGLPEIVPNCENVRCSVNFCPDRSIAPIPHWDCCPDIKLCPINFNGTSVQCFPKRCPDGNLAPTPHWWPEEECCNTGNVGGVGKTCFPDNPNPGSGSVCCPDAGLCKRDPKCFNVTCGIVPMRCKDGSSPGYMKDACCPSLWLCLDPIFK